MSKTQVQKTCIYCSKPYTGTPYEAPKTTYDPATCSISCTVKMRRDKGLAARKRAPQSEGKS